MKVLLVHSFYSAQGGEDIVYAREKKALEQRLGIQNVLSYTVSSKGLKPAQLMGGIFFSRKHYRQVYRLVKQEQVDIVHVHNFFPVLSASVFKAAKAAGAAVVHTLHNYRWWCIGGIFYRENAGTCTLCTQRGKFLSGIRYRCYRRSLLQSLAAQLAFWYYKRTGVWKCIDRFIVLSRFQQQQLVALGLDPARMVLKSNMVDTTTAVTGTAMRKGYLFAGRLETSKGIVLLLDAWTRLPLHFQLTVVGTGILEQELKQRYRQSNIIFKGACTNEETMACMAQSKYTIQASLWYETFGLTIIESMQLGVPVIGFDIGTRPELISHGKTGFICTPDTLEDCIRSSDTFQEYPTMCAEAKQYAEQYRTGKLLPAQLAIYDELRPVQP